MSNAEIAEELESAIGSLTAVRERLLAGNKIQAGEDMHDWLLYVNDLINQILDEC